jgi:hypothetical protein
LGNYTASELKREFEAIEEEEERRKKTVRALMFTVEDHGKR